MRSIRRSDLVGQRHRRGEACGRGRTARAARGLFEVLGAALDVFDLVLDRGVGFPVAAGLLVVRRPRDLTRRGARIAAVLHALGVDLGNAALGLDETAVLFLDGAADRHLLAAFDLLGARSATFGLLAAVTRLGTLAAVGESHRGPQHGQRTEQDRSHGLVPLNKGRGSARGTRLVVQISKSDIRTGSSRAAARVTQDESAGRQPTLTLICCGSRRLGVSGRSENPRPASENILA
jgi:hypothetical protein